MQVRDLLLLTPLVVLGCQNDFEECGRFSWGLCAYRSTESNGDSETTNPTDPTQPTVPCGDGFQEGNEVCDAGPQNTPDPWKQQKTCADDCMRYAEYCGDRVHNPAYEACDDPSGKNTVNVWEQTQTCKHDCSDFALFCGDGTVNGPELCDSGPDNSNDYSAEKHCNAECKDWAPHCGDGVCQAQESLDTCPDDCTPVCGDGEVQAGEQCDGGGDTMTCNADCTFAGCGDGYHNRAANEACDDGNEVETDDCRNDCTAASCGDGVVQAGVEGCDDGNDIDTDACSNACVPPRRVFVTNGSYTPMAIQGVLGADTICRNAAAAVPGLGTPGNTWLAWLSDGTSSPSTRIDAANKSFTGWYLLPTGAPVAKGWSGLTDGTLDNPIQVTEAGMMPGSPNSAWTNTKTDGTSAGANDCDDWKVLDENMTSGSGAITQTSAAWTQDKTTLTCVSSLRLYCLEVTP